MRNKEATVQANIKNMKKIIRQISACFRDSSGGTLIERFEEMTKIIFCKFYDDRIANRDTSYSKRFFAKKDESSVEVYDRIFSLYREAIQPLSPELKTNYETLTKDIAAVRCSVDIMQDVDISSLNSDLKGLMYEELIKDTFDKTEHQQFFTPRPIVNFIIDMLPLSGEMYICDPACGSGGFLIRLLEMNSQNDSNCLELSGFEIDRRMAWTAQMNVLMHGGEANTIQWKDDGGSLSKSKDNLPEENTFDLIITNPPFGSDLSDQDMLDTYELGRDRNSRRRGVLFVERCINWLKPRGHLAIILEDSVLNGKSNFDVREYILQNTIVDAVVSLPETAFMPYATAKTSILLLRKKEENMVASDHIFMANVENIGRKRNGEPHYESYRDENNKPILVNDLPEIITAWKAFNDNGVEALQKFESNIFVCPRDRLKTDQSNRLDTQYHHPARSVAENTLNSSFYPTPKLKELVVRRKVYVSPNDEAPNEIWRYMGLANIEAETGEYEIAEIYGHNVKSNVSKFCPGDILFSKLRPELRKCVLIDENDEFGYVSSECIVLTPIQQAREDTDLSVDESMRNFDLHPKYLEIMLRSDIVYGQLVFQTTGIGRPRINIPTLMNVRIPIPPIELQAKIVEEYETSWKKSQMYKRKSAEALEKSHNIMNETYSEISNQLYEADA